MAKNTKNYRTQKGSRKSARTAARTPGWVWLFTGLILGLLIAGFIYIRYFADSDLQIAKLNTPMALGDRITAAQPEIKGDIQPQFEQQEKKMIAQEKTSPKPTPKTTASSAAATPAPEEKPRFEFYTMLPDIEVPVGNKEQATKNTEPAPTTSTYLQLGSFSNAQEADTMKASLNLKGFETHMKLATVNGAKYYRLVMGPYTNDTHAREMQKKLSAAHISSIVLRETV